ncbi:putative oxidoreductase [Pseudomonas sp. ok272]|uniref:DoxX family protein n=1 Tax=unclassified Pseudomonas TaxID=196821 RepID=UPI0008CDB46B|nr:MULTISPECIES: DoxX family protein [unclassified Pseudomonas]SEM36246.1 putative oxidoreductase [Pseudomonas sp. ok272]SFM36633.1 putative oxidoreductase [Pseudomonas sp. ok602]
MNIQPIAHQIEHLVTLLNRIPHSLIAFIARFSIAAVFWKSGQTKVEGLAIDLIDGTVQLGVPQLAASTVPLFKSEYHLPLLSPEVAAYLAALAEHAFPILILLGLATRFSALVLLAMTLTIQLFVYPDAYPTHGTWAALLLYLMATGPGTLSIDHLIARHYRCSRSSASPLSLNQSIK